MHFLNLQVTQAELLSGLISVSQTVAQIVLVMTVASTSARKPSSPLWARL